MMGLAEMTHLLNLYSVELKALSVCAPTVAPECHPGGWFLVNRWADGSEEILDYDSLDGLLRALEARLRNVQYVSAALGGGA